MKRRPPRAERFLLAALLPIAACKKSEQSPAEPPSKPREVADLGPYRGVMPKLGVLVEECGLAARGPECVRVIFDASKNLLTYRPWQPAGGTAEKSLDLSNTRAAPIWARAQRVLAARALAARNASDVTLHLVIRASDDDAVAVEVAGPFTDPETAALVDELIALAK